MKKIYQGKIIKKLSNLKFAIILLLTIGLLIALGTVIEQNQNLAFYQDNYPEIEPVLGFLTWKVINFFNLDRIYTSWWFLMILILFAGSLLACTFTTQLPSFKTFKIWKFLANIKQIESLNLNTKLKLKLSNTVTYQFHKKNYHIFRQKYKSYGYSGLIGRVAPVIVHISIVLLLIGSTIGTFTGYTVQQIVPRGELFHIQNVVKLGALGTLPRELSFRINDFWITYTPEEKTDQFYSDLSILNSDGAELKRKTVFVNEPFLYKGITLYQTDWDLLGLKIELPNKIVAQIPLKKITKDGKSFWFGSFPGVLQLNNGVSIVINDLQGKILVYDNNGNFKKELFLGEKIELSERESIKTLDFITSTGLQIKSDPGIITVYFSFFLLIMSIYTSFLSYSEFWVLEKKQQLLLGGQSNRAVLFFQEEFRKIIQLTDVRDF